MNIAFDEDRAEAWWSRLCGDEDAMTAWLIKLHKTELDGYYDNLAIIEKYGVEGLQKSILTKTAEDERRHASLLEDLLAKRGIDIEGTSPPESDYWRGMEAYVDGKIEREYAVLYYGEALASARFAFIGSHPKTPKDVSDFVAAALPDERYHAEGFRRLSTPEAISFIGEAHLTVMGAMTEKYAKSQ